MPDERRQGVEEVIPAYHYFVVLGANCLRDFGCVAQLAERRFLVAYREALDRVGCHSCHQGCDRARIDSPAEEHAKRHVAHQPHPDRFLQARATFRDPLGLCAILDPANERRLPVPLNPKSFLAQEETVPRHQLVDAGKERAIAAQVAISQIFRK
jgi:hypothetical protein